MFVLAALEDVVTVEAKCFAQKFTKSIFDALNKKYANKVVHEVGLCITVWDLTHVGDSILYQGDGAAHTKVAFRMVVFRPFVDEILNGRVRKSSIEGVHVTLDFFEDIFIPADCLPQPCRFIESSQKWVWEYESDGARHNLPIDRGGEIRFKVTEEVFVEKIPTSCDPPSSNQQAAASSVVIKKDPEHDDNVPPYTVLGSIEESGLGMLSWWNGS